jgi:hypothetical protein
MEYSIKAIPTLYRGVQFRSRLEARWAAMFDLMGWNWRYEPLDFDGWIPDFIIKRAYEAGDDLLVEVKPFLWGGRDAEPFLTPDVVGKFPKELPPSMQETTEWRIPKSRGVLVLGAELHPVAARGFDDSFPTIGVWRSDSGYAEAALIGGHGEELDLFEGNSWYRYKLRNIYDGDHHLEPPEQNLDALWAQAGNKVQYRRVGA